MPNDRLIAITERLSGRENLYCAMDASPIRISMNVEKNSAKH